MDNQRQSYSIELGRKSITWDLGEGTVTSGGALAIILWLKPSLLHILQPLVDELGVSLFRLLIAYSSGLGAEQDYRSMVMAHGGTFEEGFRAWGEAVAASGWGRFELLELDREARRAVVRVTNPWELQMQGGVAERWGCPFLQGKIIGIFSHLFGSDCWADELDAPIDGGAFCVDIHVYASAKTITSELEALRRTQKQAARRKLAEMARDLHESEARQRAILGSLGEVVYTLSLDGRVTSYHVPRELAAFCSPPGESIGRAMPEVFSGDVAEKLKIATKRVLATGTPETLSYEREHGSVVRYFNAKMSALYGQGGEIVGVTVIERDFTDQVLAQRALSDRLALIERQRETIRAMSTPILRIWPGVLALPIIGEMDQPRALAIMDDVLEAITESSARVLVLDLTGVYAVDTATVGHFEKIVIAAEMLGTECLMCGIRRPVAQAMAELGMSPGATKTFSTMQAALKVAIQRVPPR
jgi:rsbT co-antagonist protein RsbR